MKLKPTEQPGILTDPKGRFRVVLYHPDTESRYFFGTHKTLEKAIQVRNAERDIGGYTTTRRPRQRPQDAPEAPAAP